MPCRETTARARAAAMQIALNDEERQTLVEILIPRLPSGQDEVLPTEASGLREEVYKTENFDYREQFKRREAIIKQLLARLAPAAARDWQGARESAPPGFIPPLNLPFNVAQGFTRASKS